MIVSGRGAGISGDKKNTLFLILGYIAAYGTPKLVICKCITYVECILKKQFKSRVRLDCNIGLVHALTTFVSIRFV